MSILIAAAVDSESCRGLFWRPTRGREKAGIMGQSAHRPKN